MKFVGIMTYIVLSAMLISVLSIALIVERQDTLDRFHATEFDVWLKQFKEANKDLVVPERPIVSLEEIKKSGD